MMHSRGFVLSENQAFAGQTRTPGPSRLHVSPTRKNMTTGKRGLGESSKLFGQDTTSVGSKQLFQRPSKSPVKALGNRNAAKTPGASDGGPSKGRGAAGSSVDASPFKNGCSEVSPRKATTSNALRSINGKQRQQTELPFTKPAPGSTENAANATMTPAPSQLGKARSMSRQNSFVTPAANVGRAGQIKARMGELLDAEMGLSMQKADGATEEATEEPAAQLTEEAMYPEIEYMPSSFHAKHPVFEFPDELDDLPRAKQLGAKLSTFSPVELRAARAQDLSDTEIPPMEAVDDVLLAPASFMMVDSDDDDPWPDVPVIQDAATVPAPSIAAKTIARPVSAGLRPSRAIPSKQAMASAGAVFTTSGPFKGRTAMASAANQSAVRSASLQRSIASAPTSRTASSVKPFGNFTSKTATATTGVGAPVRPIIGAKSMTVSSVPPQPAARPLRGSSQAVTQPERARAAVQKAATRINPKLVDFVDDDLGKQTAAALARMDAEDDIETLHLDLDLLSDEDG